MARRLITQQNFKQKPRWPLLLLATIALFLLTYLLIPLWLGDDIYLCILIPHFQGLILGLMGLTALIGVRQYFLDLSRRPSNTPTLSATSDQSPHPTHARLRKFSLAALSQLIVPAAWSIELIHQLSTAQFTHMCLTYYAIKGMTHSTNTLGLSTGLNILIWQNDIVSKVIHCSNDRVVEINSLRQFLGVLVHERAHAGVYIHRGTFSEEVRLFAASHNIQLRNEYALLAKIKKLSERRQQQLLNKILD